MLHYYRLITNDPRRIVAFFVSNDAIGTIILPRPYDQCIGETREFGISIFDIFVNLEIRDTYIQSRVVRRI